MGCVRIRLAVLAALVSAGCSLVLDTDALRDRDGRPDAEVPGPDADPQNLDVTGATPAAVDEGTGADGGRPAVVLIEGDSITSAVSVTAAWEDGGLDDVPEIVDTVVAASSEHAAIALRVPVLPELPAGDTRTLVLTFAQADVVKTLPIEITGLGELELTAGTVAVTSLAARYSRIAVTGAVRFTGTAPVILRATAGVTVGGALDVSGGTPGAGPHGCPGGSAGSAGCGVGAGGPGADATLGAGGGGGGGGFGAAGSSPPDDGGGTVGQETGNVMLVPLVTQQGAAGNRGNGGGRGGDGTVGGAGGSGGGGGGVIAIFAGGTIDVKGGGVVANGGPGGGTAGGGGGGSGGAILVRTGAGITGAGGWLTADGGRVNTGATKRGGVGAIGRIRVDTPVGSVAEVRGMGTVPEPSRGPAWAPGTPVLVASPEQTLTLTGNPGRTFGVLLNDVAIADVAPGPSGSVSVPVTLRSRHINEVCAVYTRNADATDLGREEATTCVEIAYLP
jgi:hypothetical protein